MIFHEVFGSYYLATSSILKEAVRGTLTGKDISTLVQKYAFGESLLTIPDRLKSEKWRLLHKDFSTPLIQEPSIPLSILEKRWMKAILMDPRIQLFHPDMTGLSDVEPLFTPDMIVYYDQYTNGDAFTDPEYIRHFDTILQAFREKRNLYVIFETGRHSKPQLVVTPHYLEYSEKDDRFRLIAASRKRHWVINLSRLTVCELSSNKESAPYIEADKHTVTFEIDNTRNTMERVLLHFSHLEKETKRLNDNRYQVTMKYDKKDETEMVIRILSFGPNIRVTGPENLIAILQDRINKQLAYIPKPADTYSQYKRTNKQTTSP